MHVLVAENHVMEPGVYRKALLSLSTLEIKKEGGKRRKKKDPISDIVICSAVRGALMFLL